MERTIPLQPIKTIEELEAYMIALLKEKEYSGSPITRENVMRFVAYRLSEEANDGLSRRDWIDVFMDGMPAMTETCVNEWVATFFADWDDIKKKRTKAKVAYLKEYFTLLDELILDFMDVD